jgi:chromosomal replication initiator protein
MPLTPQLVESLLVDLLPNPTEIQPKEVVSKVAEAWGVSVDRLLSRERTKEVALPRQIAMYLLRQEANISLPKIGEALGGRDHTTVMYACEKVSDLLERDDRFRRQVVEIRQQIYGQASLKL